MFYTGKVTDSRTGLPIATYQHASLLLRHPQLTAADKRELKDIFCFCYQENIWQETLRLLCSLKKIALPETLIQRPIASIVARAIKGTLPSPLGPTLRSIFAPTFRHAHISSISCFTGL